MVDLFVLYVSNYQDNREEHINQLIPKNKKNKKQKIISTRDIILNWHLAILHYSNRQFSMKVNFSCCFTLPSYTILPLIAVHLAFNSRYELDQMTYILLGIESNMRRLGWA
jgi:hypothetical protein